MQGCSASFTQIHFRKSMIRLCLGLLIGLFCPESPALASSIKALSLNLHGYHPYQEEPRYLQDASGKLSPAEAQLHFFGWQELERGRRKRQTAFVQAVTQIRPDLILFQEVGAGSPHSSKTCQEFYHGSSNEARRLGNALEDDAQSPFQLLLACRGNVGWFSHPDTFRDHRIVTKKEASDQIEVIHDFGSNPYPHGILVEGMAILAHPRFQVVAHENWNIPFNSKGERVFAQFLTLKDQDLVLLILNLHGGHKVSHFEQAVALREKLNDTYSELRKRFKGHSLEILVAGDFNSTLYRPQSSGGNDPTQSEISSVPWEMKVEDQFDFLPSQRHPWQKELEDKLWNLNRLTRYKNWANILDPHEAWERIRSAVATYTRQKWKWRLSERVDEANKLELCHPPADLTFSTGCHQERRIDLFFSTQGLKTQNAWILQPGANWRDTSQLSDHPGIYVELETFSTISN